MTSWHVRHLPEFTLLPKEIDLWAFPLLKCPPQIDSLLTSEELDRANRFHFPRHQRRFKIARAMLKFILAGYAHKKTMEIEFSYNAYGKPRLEPASDLEFNLTHSGEFALLAVAREDAVGIDLELFSARPYDGLAAHSFTKKEVQHYHHYSPAFKPMVFFHIWTQKEALMKATGLGFHYPTQAFEVSAELSKKTIVEDPLHQRQWQMISFMPKLASSAALCCNLNIVNINYLEVNPCDLLSFDGKKIT